VHCAVKTAERIIDILSQSDRPIILVFRHQGSLRKSEGVTPNGGAKYKGGSQKFVSEGDKTGELGTEVEFCSILGRVLEFEKSDWLSPIRHGRRH